MAARRVIPSFYLQQVPHLVDAESLVVGLSETQLRVGAIRIAQRALRAAARFEKGDDRLVDPEAVAALVAAAEGRIGDVPEAVAARELAVRYDEAYFAADAADAAVEAGEDRAADVEKLFAQARAVTAASNTLSIDAFDGFLKTVYEAKTAMHDLPLGGVFAWHRDIFSQALGNFHRPEEQQLASDEVVELERAVRAVVSRDARVLRDVDRRISEQHAQSFWTWVGADDRPVSLIIPPGEPADWPSYVDRHADTCAVHVEMWSREHAETDLTLELELVRTSDAVEVHFVGLHAL